MDAQRDLSGKFFANLNKDLSKLNYGCVQGEGGGGNLRLRYPEREREVELCWMSVEREVVGRYFQFPLCREYRSFLEWSNSAVNKFLF